MRHGFTASGIRRLVILGNHLPRQCGVNTFSTDLSDSTAEQFSKLDCVVVSMNDGSQSYLYLH